VNSGKEKRIRGKEGEEPSMPVALEEAPQLPVRRGCKGPVPSGRKTW